MKNGCRISEFILFKIKNTHYQVLQAAFNGHNFMVVLKEQ